MSKKDLKAFKIPYVKEDTVIFVSYGAIDFKRAKAFYKDLFGWEITWDGPEEVGWCEFQLPAPRTRFGIDLIRNPKDFTPSFSLNINVTDLEATENYIKKKGVKTDPIIDIPNMISMFTMFDPEGNKVTFLSEARVKT